VSIAKEINTDTKWCIYLYILVTTLRTNTHQKLSLYINNEKQEKRKGKNVSKTEIVSAPAN
jgi:hypothetical protein